MERKSNPTVAYDPAMQIVNAEQLPKGTGARYLEVLEDEAHGTLIAVRWHRTIPDLPAGHLLVKFGGWHGR